MRQIVLQAPGEFIDRQVPSPGAAKGEALIRIRAVGVCGSDFHAFAGRHPAYTYPRVLGHELSGIVVQLSLISVVADAMRARQGAQTAVNDSA
jgi:threonine dehydrogenase-like Zn-dependent dehydrogenase